MYFDTESPGDRGEEAYDYRTPPAKRKAGGTRGMALRMAWQIARDGRLICRWTIATQR